MSRMKCPTEAQLVRFVDADLSPECANRVTMHLGHCERCILAVTELKGMVKDLAATPAIDLDVSTHVSEVMHLLDKPAIARPTVMTRIATATALAASVALLIGVVGLRHGAPLGTWQARGGSQPASLSRDVGVQLYARKKSLQPLHPGDSIASDTALTAGLRNLGPAAAHLLLFAIDARGVVHWILPKYTRKDEDPSAMTLPNNPEETLLPTSVVFDDLAPGPLRIVTVVSPSPLRVSQVEALDALALERGNLTRRFAAAEVRELLVDVTRANRENQ